MQTLLGLALGLEAFFGTTLQFQGNASALVGFDGGDQNPGHLCGFIANRAVGQIQPEIGFLAVALHAEPLLAEAAHLTLQHRLVNRLGKVSYFRPDLMRRLPERFGMLAASEQGETIVVDLRELRAP